MHAKENTIRHNQIKLGQCLLGHLQGFDRASLCLPPRGNSRFPDPLPAPRLHSIFPPMKQKILFVITKSNWGGAQRYVYDLATSLSKEDFNIAVAFGGEGGFRAPAGLLSVKLKEREIRTLFVKNFMRNVWMFPDIAAFFEIRSLIAKERPDIIHLNSSKAGALGAIAGRVLGIKRIIFTSHGLVYDEDRNPLARIALLIGTWITFLLSYATITISKDTFSRAKKLPFCARKIHLVYNGIPPRPFKERSEAQKALGISDENPPMSIGTISELTENKGLSYLVEALRKLKEKGVPFSVYIIGEGAERESLKNLIRESGLKDTVRLLGFVKDAAAYLTAFDIFTLTSTKEGLPYVILEAGQAALPVVGSRIPGILDIVEHGTSGTLTTPKNSEEIAHSLLRYINDKDLRRAHGVALRQKVQTLFSAKEMARQTIHIYRS